MSRTVNISEGRVQKFQSGHRVVRITESVSHIVYILRFVGTVFKTVYLQNPIDLKCELLLMKEVFSKLNLNFSCITF